MERHDASSLTAAIAMDAAGSFGRRTRSLRGSLLIAAQIGLGCLFLISGLAKLRLPYEFLSGIYEYRLFDFSTGLFLAAFVPWLELCLGICLVARILEPGAIFIASSLLAAFVAVQAVVVSRHLSVQCNCFGTSESSVIDGWTLARTGVLAGLAVVCLLRHARRDAMTII